MSKEIFKDIAEYEGLYQISNYGRVKSYPKKFGNSNRLGKILKIYNRKNGYLQCMLTKHSKPKNYSIHRLVAIHFIENPLKKPEVNHIDGNKLNNFYKNLEWCTKKENESHAVKFLLKANGERNGYSKLREKDIVYIRKNNKIFTRKYLSKIFKVSCDCINDIIKKRTWKYVK